MLIEPGPIALLDLAWFEHALGILPPLDVALGSSQALLQAADAMDAIVVSAGLLDPPDDVENADTLAADAAAAGAVQLVGAADTGFDDELNLNRAALDDELKYYQGIVYGPALIAVPGTALEADALAGAIDALPDLPLLGDGKGGDDTGDGKQEA